ncbi:hypothetical protein ACFQU7_22460 [Pseudoroseomonas wenyumeiae]
MTVLAALLEQPLPEPVRDLPTGLFATAEGPFWAETTLDSISFMGGYERLVAEPDGGARSLPAYLDIRLQAEGQDVLAGQVGGAERRFLRVSPEQRLDPALVGDWREEQYDLAMTIRADGAARLPWAGGTGAETRLTALPGGRALADLAHGPWRHRPCLWLQADGSLRLASHRARVLHFTRPNP